MIDDVFEAFRCCVTERKCQNHDCPYESRCNIVNGGSNQYIQIPKHLALDVLNKMKELQDEADDLSFMIYG